MSGSLTTVVENERLKHDNSTTGLATGLKHLSTPRSRSLSHHVDRACALAIQNLGGIATAAIPRTIVRSKAVMEMTPLSNVAKQVAGKLS